MARVGSEDAAGVAVGLPAVGLFAFFAAADAGFDPLVWLPGGLFLLALLALVLAVRPSILEGIPRSTVVAIGLLAAFAAWSLMTIGWAAVKGMAWEGGNRALVYVVVYALFALWPWRPNVAAVLLGTFSVAVAVIGAGAVLLTIRSDDPLEAFVGGLFAEPVGYHNANAALFVIAFWPALLLGSRREVPPLARGVLLAAAALLLPLAILSQSRGSLLVFPVAAAIVFAITPNRARLLVTSAPVVATALLALDALLGVYNPGDGPEAVRTLVEARDAVAPLVAAVLVLGTVLAFLDRRIELPPRIARVGSRSLGAAAVTGCAVAILVLLPADPTGRAGDAWREFKAGHVPDTGSSHFTSGLGSNRYDFWRVGLAEFADSPVEGIGADNFAVPYVRERRSDEEPLYPHSLEIQVLSQTGLLGAALFLGFFVAAGLAVARARHLGAFGRAVAAAALSSCVYWLGHGSGDWLWEFPGLAAPALACLGLAAGLGRAAGVEAKGGSVRRRRLFAASAATVGIAGATSLTLPWLSAKEVDAAAAWRSDPRAAFDRLERARALNPLSERSDLLAGAIASRGRDWPRMRAAFERALERNPSSWYAEFELGVVDAVQGRRDSALEHLERARRLNPREPALAVLRDRILRRATVDPDDFDRFFLQRVGERTG